MTKTVAALYVETGGCYFGQEGVDAWDEARDARLYAGPYPVVAHPPCERWGRFWHGSPRKPHQFTLGDDGGCFGAALASVRAWGGVIEHPADSQAWKAHGLLAPPRSGGWVNADMTGGWTCYVEQGFYGHGARKPTWLYAFAVDLPALRWGRGEQRLHPGLVEKYGYEYARRKGVVSCIGGKDKKAKRNATPHQFRDVLLSIARSASSRSATLTGPGISLSPNAQRLTVLGSDSNNLAAASCDNPSDPNEARNSSAVMSDANSVDGGGRRASALADDLGGLGDVRSAVSGKGAGHIDRAALLGARDSELEPCLGLAGGAINEAGGGGDVHAPYIGPLAPAVNRSFAA